MTQEEQHPHFVSFTNYTDFFSRNAVVGTQPTWAALIFTKKQEGHVVKL